VTDAWASECVHRSTGRDRLAVEEVLDIIEVKGRAEERQHKSFCVCGFRIHPENLHHFMSVSVDGIGESDDAPACS
jgi:hypothetical protein